MHTHRAACTSPRHLLPRGPSEDAGAEGANDANDSPLGITPPAELLPGLNGDGVARLERGELLGGQPVSRRTVLPPPRTVDATGPRRRSLRGGRSRGGLKCSSAGSAGSPTRPFWGLHAAQVAPPSIASAGPKRTVPAAPNSHAICAYLALRRPTEGRNRRQVDSLD